MAPSTDSSAGGPEQLEEKTDDQEDDSYRPKNGYRQEKADEE
jgi:hypothetical protein